MTNAPTPVPSHGQATDDLGHGAFCEHCDESIPHEHLDVRAIIENSRDGARRRAVVMGVAGGATLVAATAAAVALEGVSVAFAALGTTALGWLLVTGVALIVTTRTGRTRGLVAGALTAAGLTPLVPLAVVLVADGWGAVAVTGATWLAAGAAASAVQARTWRALLLTPGEAGEQARARAVARRGQTNHTELTRWLVQAGLVAAATALLAVLPVAIVVLVPLAVLLAAWAGNRRR